MQHTVITGEQQEIYTKIKQYFNNIQKKIDSRLDNLLSQNPDLNKHPHFERRVLGVRPLEFQPGEPLRPDDTIHMLLYKDQVVAVVTEHRDVTNYVQFSFFNRLEEIIASDLALD